MQVFISHSHSDSPLAARVSEALRRAGLDVWNHDIGVVQVLRCGAHDLAVWGSRDQFCS